MRAKEFIAESSFRTDNPGGEWLRHEQKDAAAAGENQFGGPKRFGATTGWFNAFVLVPVTELIHIPGVMGEQGLTRDDSLAWLVKEMGENNRLPLSNGDKQYPPFIVVDYTGQPWVNEGNHRIKAARVLKWEYLPIQIKYFAGGEEADGPLTPTLIQQYDAQGKAAGYSSGNDFKGKL